MNMNEQDQAKEDARAASVTEFDKRAAYGNFLIPERIRSAWKDKLVRKVAHMHMDVPDDDDMKLERNEANSTHNGIGALGATGIAALAGLPPSILAALMLWNQMHATPTPVVTSDGKAQYEILHYDQNGKLIPIPHISELKRPAKAP